MPHFIQHHCLKSVQIRSFFWSEYWKIRTRKTFHAVHFSVLRLHFVKRSRWVSLKWLLWGSFIYEFPVHRSFSKLHPFLINGFSKGKHNAGVICCRNIACSSVWENIIKNPHQVSQPFAAVTLISEAVVRRCSSITDVPVSQEKTSVL